MRDDHLSDVKDQAAFRRVSPFLAKPIVHRGLHNIFDGVLEQTRLSITRAIEIGLPIEVDIETSADDRSFIIHDAVLDKLTNGKGRIRDLHSSKIRQASYHFTNGEPIMFLEELLDLVAGRVPLMLEFKNREIPFPKGVGMAAEILSRYRGQFAVQSFNPMMMEWFAEYYPGFIRGLVSTDIDIQEGRDHFIVSLLRNRMKLDFVNHCWSQLNCWTFQWVMEQRLPVLTWTVRDRHDWEVAKTFADNMLFEFIEPDLDDWRRDSATHWRYDLGERVDRREHLNQPAAFRQDVHKEGTAWWSRNRSWPPGLNPRPSMQGDEVRTSFDGIILALSMIEPTRDKCKRDEILRAMLKQFADKASLNPVSFFTNHALLVLKPEITARESIEGIIGRLSRDGFHTVHIETRSFTACEAMTLFDQDIGLATAERTELELTALTVAPSLILILRPANDDRIPLQVKLGSKINPAGVPSQRKYFGLPEGTLSPSFIPQEPADFARTFARLFAGEALQQSVAVAKKVLEAPIVSQDDVARIEADLNDAFDPKTVRDAVERKVRQWNLPDTDSIHQIPCSTIEWIWQRRAN